MEAVGTRAADHGELGNLGVFRRVVGSHDFEFLVAIHIATGKAIGRRPGIDRVVHGDAIRSEIVSLIAGPVDHNPATIVVRTVSALDSSGYEYDVGPTTTVNALRQLGKVPGRLHTRERRCLGLELTDVSRDRDSGSGLTNLHAGVHSSDLT